VPLPDRNTLKDRTETMRFLGYTLGDESAPVPAPAPEQMAEMEALMEEITKAGVLVATGGLAPTAMAAKVMLKDGEYTVVDGPFTEAKELIGGWALMECRDLGEAVEWAKRFVAVMGEGEVRVRPAEAVWVEGEYGPE
jgi:hypothetical protein